MQYIILIGDESLTLDSIRNIKHYDSTSSHDVDIDRYWVNFGEEHVWYDFNGDDNDKDVLKTVPFKKPKSITMVYNEKERMRQVLKQDNFLRGIYVDDDAGNIIPVEEFIECLDAMAAAGILDDFPPIRRSL